MWSNDAVRFASLALAGALLAPGTVSAAPTIVNVCTSDIAPGGTNLAAAIAQGGEISIRCPAGAAVIRITRTHQIPRSTQIDGNGQATLLGNGLAPMFTGANGLALSNLTIRNRAAPGKPRQRRPSVVESTSTLRLVRVRTERTTSPYQARRVVASDSQFIDNGDARHGSFGALINAEIIELERSRFEGNSEPLTGGGPTYATARPALRRRLEVRDSQFVDNRRGLLALDGTEVAIRGSLFRGNGMPAGGAWDCCGGALTAAHSQITISNSEFLSNRSQGAGGAVLALGSTLRISNSLFADNSARLGGAVASLARPMADGTWNEGAPAAGMLGLRLERSRFRGNRSDSAGGALVWAGPLMGDGVLFVDNVATGAGGAMAHLDRAVAEDGDVGHAVAGIVSLLAPPVHDETALANGVWVGNRAPEASAADGGRATLRFGNALLARNSVEAAAGATLRGRMVHLVNATLADNLGRGVELTDPAGDLTLANTIIAGNSDAACAAPLGRIRAQGHNLQFPGTSCGAAVQSREPALGEGFEPGWGSPARTSGAVEPCLTDPLVMGRDVRGNPRGQDGSCSVGAVEAMQLRDELVQLLQTDDGAWKVWFWLLWLLLLLLLLLGVVTGWRWVRRRRCRS